MSEVKKELLKNENFKLEFVQLENEFTLASQLIQAGRKAEQEEDKDGMSSDHRRKAGGK